MVIGHENHIVLVGVLSSLRLDRFNGSCVVTTAQEHGYERHDVVFSDGLQRNLNDGDTVRIEGRIEYRAFREAIIVASSIGRLE